MTTFRQRDKLVALMDELIANAAEIHYAQIRPMRTIRLRAPAYPMTMDCSEAVTCLCKWAGLQDPNGRGYNGSGYTGTMLEHLPHYHRAGNALPGALVVFGPGTGEHVAMVLEHDATNPLLFSHGGENGPIAIHLHDEAEGHPPPVTFLSVAAL